MSLCNNDPLCKNDHLCIFNTYPQYLNKQQCFVLIQPKANPNIITKKLPKHDQISKDALYYKFMSLYFVCKVYNTLNQILKKKRNILFITIYISQLLFDFKILIYYYF